MPKPTALITGASSGIGRDLARELAAAGYDLVLVARRHDRLVSLADELTSSTGCTAIPIALDLATRDACQQLLAQLGASSIEIDLLVNNAGFGLVGSFHELSITDQLEMIQLHVATLTELTHAILQGMVQRNRGAVLNLASTAAFQPGPNMAIYFATKAFVLSFSEALSEELRDTKVRVTCVCPGPTHTEFEIRSGVGKTLLFQLGPMRSTTIARKSLRGVRRGRTLLVPGIGNWLPIFCSRFLPRSWVRKIAARLTRPPKGRAKAN